MPIPVRHFLAAATAAGLLLLLPIGAAEAQENGNNADRVMIGHVVAGMVGGSIAIAGWLLLQLAFKHKRGKGKTDNIPTQLDGLSCDLQTRMSNVSDLEEKIDQQLSAIVQAMEKRENSQRDAILARLDSRAKDSDAKLENLKDVINRFHSDLQNQSGNASNLVIAKTRKTRTNGSISPPIIIDTSAIIDGRIVKLLKIGLLGLDGRIVISQGVLNELRGLKEPGKIGADNLINLYSNNKLKDRIEVSSAHSDIRIVDDRLCQLTNDTNGILVTTDYELTQQCLDRNLWAINLHSLYKAICPQGNPGDKFYLMLQKSERSKDSAIAYLEDGTLVVLKGAGHLIGRMRWITIDRPWVSERGFRLLFAHLTTPGEETLLQQQETS